MWKHWIWDTSPVGQPRTLLGDCAWRTVVQKDFNASRWTPVHRGKTAPACGPLSSPVSQEVKVRHSCPGSGGRGGPMGLFSREAAPVSKHRKAAGRGAASARREEQGWGAAACGTRRPSVEGSTACSSCTRMSGRWRIQPGRLNEDRGDGLPSLTSHACRWRELDPPRLLV